MNLLCIGSLFAGSRNGLVLTRRGVFTQSGRHTHGLEVVAQGFPFFRCRTFVHTENSWVLGLQNKVGAAHIGRQHGLFNQAVSFGANSGNNLFNSTTVIANDLGFGCLEIYSTALFTALK